MITLLRLPAGFAVPSFRGVNHRPLTRTIVLTFMATICSALVTACGASRHASDHSGPVDTDDALESIAEATGSDALSDEVIERLEGYRTDPLDLQRLSIEEIAGLPGFSPQLAVSLRKLLDTADLPSIDAIATALDLDEDASSSLRLYTRLEFVPDKDRGVDARLRTRFVHDVQRRRGYRDELHRVLIGGDAATSSDLDTISLGPRYIGTPMGLMTRAIFNAGSFSGSLLFEKDPGEPLFHHDSLAFSYASNEIVDIGRAANSVRTRAAPFVSGHLRFKSMPGTIIAGDYTAAFGQGLLFGKTYGGRKGSAPTSDPYAGSSGIRGYSSAGEALYLRGIGITLNDSLLLPRNLTATLFASLRSLDVSLTGDDSGSATIGSIRYDGLRRTHGELRGANAVTEQLAGGALELRLPSLKIGVAGYASGLSTSDDLNAVIGDGIGSAYSGISLNGEVLAGDHRLFVEIARSSGKDLAAIAGGALRLGKADITLSARQYPASHLAPHGVSFGESLGNPHNERGIYLGIRARPARRFLVSAYADLYRHPEATERVPFPTNGVDVALFAEYAPTREFRIALRGKSETSDDALRLEDPDGITRTTLTEKQVTNLRLEARYMPGDLPFQAGCRIESKLAHILGEEEPTHGLLTSLDLSYAPLDELRLSTRLALFDANDFDAALYLSERNVPGRVSIPALSGRGRRFYLLVDWSPLPALRVGARYAETFYTDRKNVSEGTLQEITGALASEVVFQVDIEL